MRTQVIAMALLLIGGASDPTIAEQVVPDEALEIMARSQRATEASTEHVIYEMELINADGEVDQTRRMESYFLRSEDSKSTLLKFLAPPVVEETGMLLVNREAEPSEIWLYLPVLRFAEF